MTIGDGAPLPVTFFGNYMVVQNGDELQAFPSGHFVVNEVTLNRKGELNERCAQAPQWLVDKFRKGVLSEAVTGARFAVDKRKEVRQPVALLNCLDGCYGHCLYKLANALVLEKNTTYDLVAIVPAPFVYLVPDSVAEVWVVEAPFWQLDRRLEGFHEFVAGQLARFENVRLAQAYMNFDFQQLDFSRLTKVSPFDFSKFRTEPVSVCFVLRDDRFWLTSRFDLLLYLASIKLGWLPRLRGYFNWKQNRLVAAAVRIIGQELRTNAVVVGIGSASLPGPIDDRRLPYKQFQKREGEWLQIYAASHVCIGVHGSNMLLPSYLAGACITLLPDYKIYNYSEDFLPRQEPAQKTVFLVRNLPLATPPARLATHVVSMVRGWRHGAKE